MSEKQMKLNFQCLEDDPEGMMQLLKELHDALATSFVKMNYFASGESQQEFRRITATDILGEVYFDLAGPYTKLREVLNVPELEKQDGTSESE